MRTVTSICLAAVGGITLAFFLLAVFVAPIGWLLPAVTLGLTVLLFYGALAMARQAGTPGCLPFAIFVLVTLVFFLLLWSSWS